MNNMIYYKKPIAFSAYKGYNYIVSKFISIKEMN